MHWPRGFLTYQALQRSRHLFIVRCYRLGLVRHCMDDFTFFSDSIIAVLSSGQA
jgi:hypothetical protein